MELTRLIDALSDPSAYPDPVSRIEVRQTHISVVFLAGAFVYKIKKPVSLGFLDFNSLEKRRHFCEEEVRLNRRLAPTVYRGVLPVTHSGDTIQVAGQGEVIEWAVKMEHLPESANLGAAVDRGEVGPDELQALARKVAGFHAAAQPAESRVAGNLEAVARNVRENFDQAGSLVGSAVSATVLQRLGRSPRRPWRWGPLIQARADRGVPRDAHGDFRLDHVYRFPERPPPADLVIIDCIEFNERFRFIDPVADSAFLAMDLLFHGRRDLAGAFADAYFQASGDAEGRTLLPFYISYRAAVRGKVEGLAFLEQEVPEAERARALDRSRGYWLLALGELESADRRPALLLVGGLPGSGKSTLARSLAERAGFVVLRSDVLRKDGRPCGGRHLLARMDRADLCRVSAPGRGDAVRGEARPDRCHLSRGQAPPDISAGLAALARAGGDVALQPIRKPCASAWSGAAMTSRMLTGRSTCRLRQAGRQRGRSPARPCAELPTGGDPGEAVARALAVLHEMELWS